MDEASYNLAMAQPSSAASAPTRPTWQRRLRFAAVVAGALTVLVAVLGFLVAPRLLRDALEQDGSAFLKRRVTVAEVKVNPFILTIDVDGLQVADLDAPRLLSWEKLHVRLAPWRILQGFWGVAEVRLVRPYLRAALDTGGRLNVSDLLEGDGSPSPPPDGQPRPRRLGVALDLLEVVEARVAFADATRTPGFETELGPLTVRLDDLRTRGDADSPYSLRGGTEAGETFEWQGTVHSERLASAGRIAFKGLKLPKYGPYQVEAAPGLLIPRGSASLQASYELELGAARRVMKVSGLRLLLEDLALARRRDAALAAELARVEVNGVDVDLLTRTATVAEVKVGGGRLLARREADGHLALLDMLDTRPAPPPAAPAATTTATAPIARPAAPWAWSVATVAVEGLGIEAEDLRVPRPVRLAFSDVKVTLTGLRSDPAVICPLTATWRWAGDGTVSLQGQVRPFAAAGELSLEAAGLDLAPIAPYADGASPLRLAAGTLGFKARTTFDGAGRTPRWSFAGHVRLDELAFRHPRRDEELLRWRSLELLGVDASSARQARVRVVRFTEPRLRGLVFEDGTTGLEPPGTAAAEDAEDAPPGGEAAGATPAPTPTPNSTATSTATPTSTPTAISTPADTPPVADTAAPARAPAEPPAWRTWVGLLQVRRGRLSLTDRSTSPPVNTALTDLELKVTGLSSDPKLRSAVDARARVDGAGEVTVTGTFNPLQQAAFTDLAVRAHGIDLTPLGPYAGKHLGYLIQKGKLDLELAWKVEERRLRSGNVVRFDQFTLGDETHSPDATSLPVRLLLAILTDKDGVILLDVPVDGDLDDPRFRLGRAILHTVKSLLVKLATSPFSALAALAGGGDEDLSLVEFAPGGTALDEVARKRLELLGTSLAARPALGLELAGSADPARDGAALRLAELERLLRRTKAAAQRPPADPGTVEVAAGERARWLAAAQAALPEPPAPAEPSPATRKGEAPPPPNPADLEAALLATLTIPPEALPALAASRAQAARDALLAGGLDPARLFLVEGSDRSRREPGPRAYFGVR